MSAPPSVEMIDAEHDSPPSSPENGAAQHAQHAPPLGMPAHHAQHAQPSAPLQGYVYNADHLPLLIKHLAEESRDTLRLAYTAICARPVVLELAWACSSLLGLA